MRTLKSPKAIYITPTDKDRLERVIESARNLPNVEMLEEELARATIVASKDIPSDVATMNSRILFKDMETNDELEFTLVYPGDANVTQGKISVLAPVGTALLGLRVGDEIEWPVPSGKTRSLKLLQMVFQPEAAGQFHL
jgi:regulator of nucleoside diphosphate kinase